MSEPAQNKSSQALLLAHQNANIFMCWQYTYEYRNHTVFYMKKKFLRENYINALDLELPPHLIDAPNISQCRKEISHLMQNAD